MNEFYNFHERIRDFLLSTGLIQVVTWGDVFDLDLDRKNQYALAHIMYSNITYGTQSSIVELDIIFADMVKMDIDNTLDVYNNMHVAATMLFKSIDGGDLYDFQYRLSTQPTLEPFKERFEMNLAGFTASLAVSIPNPVSRCNPI